MASLVPFYTKLHATSYYGQAGKNKLKDVLPRIKIPGVKTVLDFGAGRQSLGKVLAQPHLGFTVTSYDPAVPGIDVLPEGPFDAVVSTDVLEHIPYEEIDSLLETIVRLTGSRGFHHIATSPANLRLPDGRDAHLIQEMSAWWAKKFEALGVKVIEAIDTGKPNGRDYTAALITFDKI